jgi:AAA family ATP:ADP antiporter
VTRIESFFSLFTRIRPGEGRGIVLLGINGFLLVCAYYILKTLRESMILTEFDAETKAYAVAATAIVLFFLVPLYGVVFRHTNRTQLVVAVNGFFIVNLAMFYLAMQIGISVAFQYYIWIGVFGVMVVAQFWAYVTDIYNVRSGQRVFPLIMIATSLGALAGAQLAALAFPALGTYGLMLLAGILLTASLWLYRPARLAAPEESRCIECEFIKPKSEGLFGGFAIVLSNHYLRMIALFVVLLNWINSTGEYILSAMVVQWAQASISPLGRDALIAWFYGNFSFWVTLIGLLVQTLLVARLLRFFGLPRAIMILPLIAAFGYALIAFVPIFSIIRWVKVAENGVDVSLMSTIRQILFLPTSREVKYEGKTAVDTFFWRFGDLIQGVAIYAGIHVFQLDVAAFALGNLLLALLWTGVALAISREYCRVVAENATSRPPELVNPIPDVVAVPGQPVDVTLHPQTFVDPDPGDAIRLTATRTDGSALPRWLNFNPKTWRFSGMAPNHVEPLGIRVTASDFEQLTASDEFTIHFAAP